MNCDFIIIPNANHSPAHLGHLWLCLHARAHFLQMTISMEKMKVHCPHPVKVRWGVCFDTQSKTQHEEEFLSMMTWQGFPPDFTWHLKDFLTIPPSNLMSLCGMSLWDNVKSPPYSPPEELLRLIALRDAPFHWQGSEFRDSNLQGSAYKELFNLHIPTYNYTTMLHTEDLGYEMYGPHRINSSIGIGLIDLGLDYPYYITPEIMENPPLKVAKWLMKLVIPNESPEYPASVSLMTERTLGKWVPQLKTYGAITQIPWKPNPVIIPKDWAKGI